MTVFKRGERWVCKFYVGRVDGRERQSWRTFATRLEAETYEARLRLDGVPLAPSRLTIREYLEQWIAGHPVREQSTIRYRAVLKHHLIPGLGHLRLLRLGPGAIEYFIKRQHAALRRRSSSADWELHRGNDGPVCPQDARPRCACS